MNKNPLSEQDLVLIERSRRIASRHLETPPTPRDTLAVLRQAAEQQQEQPAHAFAWWARLAFAALLATTALTGILHYRGQGTESGAVASMEDTAESFDPGIDLASWNIEVDALMTEIDATLDQLADGSSELNTLAKGLLGMEESSL